MTYRTIAIANTVVSVFYGLFALVAPAAIAAVFGIALDAAASYEARLLGGAYIGYAIGNYLTKDSKELVTQRAVAASNAFAWAVGFVVSTLAGIQGLTNALGWSTVVLSLAFTLAWAWAYAAARESGMGARQAGAMTRS